MKTLYSQCFERRNWNLKETLEEKVCVIFETDLPHDNEHLEAFEEVMWQSLFEQYPQWQCPYNASNPPPNAFEKWRHGWGSPLMAGPIIKLN